MGTVRNEGSSRVVKVAGLAVALGLAAPCAQATSPSSPSTDPYKAGVAYANCMRAHHVPHPYPDRNGDFHLTPVQESALRKVGRAKVEAATRACFKYLRPVVSTKPLSPTAMGRAKKVLAQVSECVRKQGFELGAPVVENLTLGRAFFGFEPGDRPSKAMHRAELACEKRVQLAKKLDAIISLDRAPV
jgi:hypothetical protein